MSLFVLYMELLKIGLFSIGGGPATLPFFFDLAARYDWLSPEKLGNFLAISQSSPGAMGVNMAAQAGFAAAGIPGAFIAPLGLVGIPIVVIILVARMLDHFKENRTVGAVFSGLRPAAAGLIGAAGLGVWKLSLYDGTAPVWYNALRPREALLFAVLFALIWKFKKHPIVYIAAAGITGIVFKF
ncbi:MAG: chromate transporter [Spirochaetaceae bacterium]|jgi:chromate transporter|nr:chromate transporter [Spirochaetaceae bacterium]